MVFTILIFCVYSNSIIFNSTTQFLNTYLDLISYSMLALAMTTLNESRDFQPIF